MKFSQHFREQFLASTANNLFHYSEGFAEFIVKAIPGTKIDVLEAKRGGKLTGLLPIATFHHEEYGTVLNSLPFFGSHGSPVTLEYEDKVELMHKFRETAISLKLSSATIIENPFSPLDDNLIKASGLEVVDDRVGQFTRLPTKIEDFHVKTRNAIRKGQQLTQLVEKRNDDESWEWMQMIHEQSISALGGIPKPMGIFDALRMTLGRDMDLWIGSIRARPVSGLLTIKYGKTIEYFTPVVDHAYRDRQALSALIYEVMQRYSGAGFALWNWGGTWRNQQGVYRFKKRWSGEEKCYRYLNKVYDKRWEGLEIDSLVAAYPFFYLFKY